VSDVLQAATESRLAGQQQQQQQQQAVLTVLLCSVRALRQDGGKRGCCAEIASCPVKTSAVKPADLVCDKNTIEVNRPNYD